MYYAVLVVKWAIRDGRDTLLASAQGAKTVDASESLGDLVWKGFENELFGSLGSRVVEQFKDDT
jgi:hypothetical protein